MQAGSYCPISHGQSHSTLELGCDIGGFLEGVPAAGPLSTERTMVTKSCCVLCEVLTKTSWLKNVKDPSHAHRMVVL